MCCRWQQEKNGTVEKFIIIKNGGDSLIEQKQCYVNNRIHTACDARPSQEFIYKEENKLYYYETTLDRFLMLYDFGAGSGDTLAIEFWPNFTGNPTDSLFFNGKNDP